MGYWPNKQFEMKEKRTPLYVYGPRQNQFTRWRKAHTVSYRWSFFCIASKTRIVERLDSNTTSNWKAITKFKLVWFYSMQGQQNLSNPQHTVNSTQTSNLSSSHLKIKEYIICYHRKFMEEINIKQTNKFNINNLNLSISNTFREVSCECSYTTGWVPMVSNRARAMKYSLNAVLWIWIH